MAEYEAKAGARVTAGRLLWHRAFCEVQFATISLPAARAVADGWSHNLRLIDRARTDLNSEPGEFAVHAAIPPGGILVRQAHDHGADTGGDGGPHPGEGTLRQRPGPVRPQSRS